MKKVLGLAVAAFALMTGLGACSNNGESDKTIIQYPFTSCFAQVYDTQNQTVSYVDGVNYVLLHNVTDSKGDLDITGLTVGNITYPKITIENLPTKLDGKWFEIEVGAPKVTMNGFGTVPEFANFSFDFYPRFIGEAYAPGFATDFVVDHRYRVFSARAAQIAVGESKSTAPDGTVFSKPESMIVILFNFKTMTLTLELAAAQFAEKMPAQNITMSGIPFKMAIDGDVTFAISDLTPSIGNTPYPNYPITNLSGTYDFEEGLELEYVCTLGPNAYSVECDCKY